MTDGLHMSAAPYASGWVRLTVAGELDIATARPFGDRLIDELDGSDGVLVDLGGVEFIDSTGLALVISAVQHAAETERRLEFAQPLPAQPQQLLEMSGLLGRLTLHTA